MTERMPRPGQQHPEEWREDLNPHALAGSNAGAPLWEDEDYRTAHELKDVHARLRRMRDDDLKQIPIVPAGSRLEQGATYLDLRAEYPAPFTATGGIEAEGGTAYVAKSEVDYQLWNLLLDAVATVKPGGADVVKEERRAP
jgi:hypothetical protein